MVKYLSSSFVSSGRVWLNLFLMDDGGEGTSWLGNIVQKFEDLFSEVDVAVRQVSGYSSLLTFFV